MIQIEEQRSQENGHWARLERVIKWSGMTTNHFAHYIGLVRSENLYQIKRGNNGISRRLTDMIVEKFPSVSFSWLLTGVGEMLQEYPVTTVNMAYYDLDVERSIRAVRAQEAQSVLTLPMVVDGDFAMVYRGVAMGDVVPTNSIVVLKEVSVNQIIPGCEYLIQTSHITTLRSVRSASVDGEDSMLRLVATLSDRFDDIVVPRGDVEAAYRVAAKIVVNN